MDKPKLPVLNSIYRFWNHNKRHPLKETHTFYAFGCGVSEAPMRSEADTCQQNPPRLPLVRLTMSSSKAVQGGSLRPKALLHDFFLGVHTPELSTVFASIMSVLP